MKYSTGRKESARYMRKRVVAIILNYNSSADCGKCLSYLKEQTYPDLSIIVVDNASPDKCEQMKIRNLCEEQKIELICSKENRGFSAGNNIGLRAAVKNGADWLLVINPDVELRDPHYISYVIEQLSQWPQAAVVGTNVLLPSGERQNPMREVTAIEEIFWPFEIVKQKMGLYLIRIWQII